MKIPFMRIALYIVFVLGGTYVINPSLRGHGGPRAMVLFSSAMVVLGIVVVLIGRSRRRTRDRSTP